MKSANVSLAAWLIMSGLAGAAETTLTGDSLATREGDLVIHPIEHATLALGWKNLAIDVDPVGGAKRFANLPKPDLVLITDTHQDHLSAVTLKALASDKTVFVAPPAVASQLPAEFRQRTTVLTNGEMKSVLGIPIEAVPMYNTTPDRKSYHPKGRGNGYVLTFADKRVYISGDTEDIPEMRALKNIDVAFVCMNLPYTMTPEQAAAAVREFRPKVVYPYHSRGTDLEKFRKAVGTDIGIEIRLRDWYAPAGAARQPGGPDTGSAYTVIGHLERNDRVITIKSGPNGRVYSVATRDGKVLFENASAEQLRAQAPEIHELIRTGVAGEGTPDASLHSMN